MISNKNIRMQVHVQRIVILQIFIEVSIKKKNKLLEILNDGNIGIFSYKYLRRCHFLSLGKVLRKRFNLWVISINNFNLKHVFTCTIKNYD